MAWTGDTGDRSHLIIVNQALDYIFDHLFEKITVEMIADHCCFSPYYFNRLFRSVAGETIYSFIKRMRLQTAAFQLIKFSHQSITEVAAQLGYSSSNFAVLFKEAYGLSPSRFRLHPRLPSAPEFAHVLQRISLLQKETPIDFLERMDQKISFEDFPEMTLQYRRFKGCYSELYPVWTAFCADRERFSPGEDIQYFGISYDDPLIAGRDRCLYDLCATVSPQHQDCEENRRKIPPGRYLCYHFHDSIRKLYQAYSDLFAVWIPHRACLPGPGLCLERYRSGLGPDGRLDLDICVPVI